MTTDLLTKDLSTVRLIRHAKPYSGICPDDVWLDMDSFVSHIEQYESLDIMSYTAGQIPHTLYYRIHRLILGAPVPGEVPMRFRSRTHRLLNIHTKLWIGFNSKMQPKAAYVGSYNIGAATIENVMVRVANPKFWLRYFDHFWMQTRSTAPAITDVVKTAQTVKAKA